jgi:6-phosphofructokinase 2
MNADDAQIGGIVTLTVNPALDVSTSTARVVATEKLRCADPRYDPGGGGINVARAIHHLGGDALAIYAAGGMIGQTLSDLLADENVSTRSVAIVGRTRESLAVNETTSGLQFRFVLPGPHLSETELAACLEALRALEPKPAYIVASGSLPAGAPPGFYGQVTDVARALGANMVLDTSGDALRAAVEHGGIYLLKPSRRELESLAGRELPDEREMAAAAGALIAQGKAQIIVVSLGASGALMVTKGSARLFPVIPVKVASTIAAGDAMMAGMVLALARGWALEDSMRFGMATASASLLRPGNQLCRREDAERLYAEAREQALSRA